MSRCDKCNNESTTSYLNEFGYKILCGKCYREFVDKRDYRTPQELQQDSVIYSLTPEQTVKNFVKYFSEYKNNPTAELLQALWSLQCWAGHADHTASTAIHEICKRQKFDFYAEFKKFKTEGV